MRGVKRKKATLRRLGSSPCYGNPQGGLTSGEAPFAYLDGWTHWTDWTDVAECTLNETPHATSAKTPRKGRSGRRVLGCRRPLRDKRRGCYFLAMKVYLPLSSDSLSSQMTVHLPSPLNLAFTAPFFVSYTAHTSSLFSETDHA